MGDEVWMVWLEGLGYWDGGFEGVLVWDVRRVMKLGVDVCWIGSCGEEGLDYVEVGEVELWDDDWRLEYFWCC